MKKSNTIAVSRNGILPVGGAGMRLVSRVPQPSGNTVVIYTNDQAPDIDRARSLMRMWGEEPGDADIIRSVGLALERMQTRGVAIRTSASRTGVAADLFAALGGQDGKEEK